MSGAPTPKLSPAEVLEALYLRHLGKIRDGFYQGIIDDTIYEVGVDGGIKAGMADADFGYEYTNVGGMWTLTKKVGFEFG